jgi:hypothetical protein
MLLNVCRPKSLARSAQTLATPTRSYFSTVRARRRDGIGILPVWLRKTPQTVIARTGQRYARAASSSVLRLLTFAARSGAGHRHSQRRRGEILERSGPVPPLSERRPQRPTRPPRSVGGGVRKALQEHGMPTVQATNPATPAGGGRLDFWLTLLTTVVAPSSPVSRAGPARPRS